MSAHRRIRTVRVGALASPERTALHDAERDRVPALWVLSPSDVDQQALLDEWVLRQRAAGLSEKTIRERVGVIGLETAICCRGLNLTAPGEGRLSNAANLTAVDVERFLANPAWARSTRATYHGAIRAWSLWLIRTGRRRDDPTFIATTPKIPKGRPRPLADQHLAVLLSTRMARRTWAMILLGAYAVLRVSEIAAIRGAPPCDPGPARGRSWGTVQGATHE